MDNPLLVLVISLAILWLATILGSSAIGRLFPLTDESRDDYSVLRAATLAMLGLVIGFTFEMAVSRYDHRKGDEANESITIGTEFLRADLLPAADAATLKGLIKAYLQQRVLFYETRDADELASIKRRTEAIEGDLWSIVRAAATAQPTPALATTISGMNEMLDSRAATQAAWLNRIPPAAWGMMGAIAVFSAFLVGYCARIQRTISMSLLILPVILSVAFCLIADIDSPRGGIISVEPHNLNELYQSIRNTR